MTPSSHREDNERAVPAETEDSFHRWLKQWMEKYDTEQERIEAAAAAEKKPGGVSPQ